MYKEKLNELFEKMKDNQIMVLATSKNNIVSARSMSVIIYNDKLYFQTDLNFNKYSQIRENPNVALTYNNISIEGRCIEIGHPLSKENLFFAKLFEKYYTGSFKAYTSLESERLLEVSPLKISLWDYEDNKPYQEFYDLVEKTYTKKYYL